MTIKEAIDKVNELNPNQYSEELKVDWLSRLDYQIFEDIILTHKPNFPHIFPKKIMPKGNALNLPEETWYFPKPKYIQYSVENMTEPLLVPFPFDELYIAYLQMKIAEANQETAQYNNYALLYNSHYKNYAVHYNKDHEPININRYNMWRV